MLRTVITHYSDTQIFLDFKINTSHSLKLCSVFRHNNSTPWHHCNWTFCSCSPWLWGRFVYSCSVIDCMILVNIVKCYKWLKSSCLVWKKTLTVFLLTRNILVPENISHKMFAVFYSTYFTQSFHFGENQNWNWRQCN